jgi:hypothetical protein
MYMCLKGMNMKKAMIDYIQKKKQDNYYTPEYAIIPLLKYINKLKYADIWECCDPGNSKITKVLKENGFGVVSTDIQTGYNFFKYEPKDYDIIITNPPYSLKTAFLKRCYELGKPFALLLPLTALEGIERSKLYRKYGIELLIFDKRIEFMNNKGKNGCWFNTSWFCHRVLPERLIFHELIKK